MRMLEPPAHVPVTRRCATKGEQMIASAVLTPRATYEAVGSGERLTLQVEGLA